MQISAPNKSFRLLPATFKTYIALQKLADDSGLVKVSYNKIKDVCHCSQPTAVRTITRLEKAGLLTKRFSVGESDRSNIYQINPDDPVSLA